MTMLYQVLLLVLGTVILLAGANWLINGASAIARRFNISELVIGLTVVAFGTSAPELSVNIFSAVEGSTAMAIGNVIGSNTFNTFFILGISAIIFPLQIKDSTAWKEIPLSLLAALLVFILANDVIIDQAHDSNLSRIDGMVLIAFFLIFMFYTYSLSKTEKIQEPSKPSKSNQLGKNLVLFLVGLACLILGANFMVNAAKAIAIKAGISEGVIGLTIVSAGTSLPELATSAWAAYQKESDMAVGNVIGSNIFNVFFILGSTALIKPLPFNETMNFDVLVAASGSLLLFGMIFTGKKSNLSRWEGGLLAFFYLLYIWLLLN